MHQFIHLPSKCLMRAPTLAEFRVEWGLPLPYSGIHINGIFVQGSPAKWKTANQALMQGFSKSWIFKHGLNSGPRETWFFRSTDLNKTGPTKQRSKPEFWTPVPNSWASTCQVWPTKETWWRADKGNLLHSLGHAVGRGKVSTETVFRQLWESEVSFSFK
jgi:hypothetical protein